MQLATSCWNKMISTKRNGLSLVFSANSDRVVGRFERRNASQPLAQRYVCLCLESQGRASRVAPHRRRQLTRIRPELGDVEFLGVNMRSRERTPEKCKSENQARQ